MQKFFFFICVFVSFLLSIQSYAAVITVDANHPSVGMYKSLYSAHEAANSGDTILVYPFAGLYNAIEVTKKLRIIGRGWYDVFGKNISTAISGTMTFSEGSDGSSLEGFEFDFRVFINANDITVKRNDLSYIRITNGHSGTVIMQNYICADNDNYTLHIYTENEAFIANNIIINKDDYSNASGIYATSDSVTINIIHNIILGSYYSLSVYGSNHYVANNILIGKISAKDYTGFHNNLINVDLNTVYDSNNWYKLKENSPAIGTGTNGTDIGIYGGSTPFVLGGYPSIPRIVNIEADHLGTKSHGLDVKIKATTVRE